MADSEIKRTDARSVAMRQVMDRFVTYDAASGEFAFKGVTLAGAMRRTYAELRQAGIFAVGAQGVSTVALSDPTGKDLARDWGLTSRP